MSCRQLGNTEHIIVSTMGEMMPNWTNEDTAKFCRSHCCCNGFVQTIGHKRRIPPQKNHAMQLTKEITSIE
jgi:hypothetical protein